MRVKTYKNPIKTCANRIHRSVTDNQDVIFYQYIKAGVPKLFTELYFFMQHHWVPFQSFLLNPAAKLKLAKGITWKTKNIGYIRMQMLATLSQLIVKVSHYKDALRIPDDFVALMHYTTF